MKVNNLTKIPNRIINYFLRDLGIYKASGTITIELADCNGNGLCRSHGNNQFTIYLAELSLSTLAHELKHVEQHVSGLSEYMTLERELTPYRERWHEVEAREYARPWKGKKV